MGDAYADIPRHGGDYAKAISVCINSLVCLRPIDRGVMCPSFRVTRNGNHSPGGRVRLLKQALNAESPDQALLDADLAEAMDLCVSCKGCKRECESNVDMAKIKAEYQAQKLQLQPLRGALARRQKLFASLPEWLARYPVLKALIRLRNKLPQAGWIGEKLMRVSARRQLPLPAPESYYKRGFNSDPLSIREVVGANAAGETSNQEAQKTPVLLLVDSFNNHFKPEQINAAVTVLRRLGYLVLLPAADERSEQNLCCGRTNYSSGDVATAREKARKLLARLAPAIENDMPIIGLEPSCLLMLRDEYLSMGLGKIAAKASKLAVLFEEFVAKALAKDESGELFESAEQGKRLLVHGHCHHKSVGAMKSVRKILKQIPGLDFEMIEASCCGGAGSFAFESEHEAISRDMFELSLGRALAKDTEAEVLTTGFSCSHQIKDLAGRDTIDMATLLVRYLKVG